METDKTLNDYIALLSSKQQEYIVHCVLQYGDRPDFHRGLLPFLPAVEAARCLQFKLEDMKAAQALKDVDMVGNAMLGEKFIRQMISVFSNALIYRLSDDEASEVIRLRSVKLKRVYSLRFGKKFCIRLSELGIDRKKPIDGLYELQMISRDMWKITGKKDYLSAVAQHLYDCYGC